MEPRKLRISVILCSVLAWAACTPKGTDEDNSLEDVEPVVPAGGIGRSGAKADDSVAVPQVGSINLSSLVEDDDPALRLADEPGAKGKCEKQKLGAFGLALGAACHTSGLASALLLGREQGDFDGDGDVDCGDFLAAKDDDQAGGPGIMLSLMCQGVFLNNPNVVSLAFADAENPKFQAMAVSFADYENDVAAVGSWTKGNAASYPADIRLWGGTGMTALEPMFAMGLSSLNAGTVFVDKMGDSVADIKVEYANQSDGSLCASAPSKSSCHWQDIQAYSGDGLVENGPPNQFHLRVFADNKENPSFLALEGRYGYSPETAAKAFAADASDPNRPDLTAIRSVYFQVIKKDKQIWGRMIFKDESGALLSWEMPAPTGTIDIFAQLAAEDGVCQNTNSSDWVACTDIDPSSYQQLWDGLEGFAAVAASPVEIDWTSGKPEQAGLCNTSKCIGF